VPSLERRLVDARLDQLADRAATLAEELPNDRILWDDAVDDFAVATNSRVLAFTILTTNPPTPVPVADSNRRGARDLVENPVLMRAFTSGNIERGRVTDATGDNADVAVPVAEDAMLLFRAPLEDSVATVELVKRRFLLAAGFALAVALVLGLTAAGMLAHRLSRLETSAERIAGGDFDVPIVDHGDDELGQLALAFDRMRVQLAQLDTARKEFVANASHELRTPIFSLGGFLELLTDEDLDEETRRGFLETMQGQVERLARLSTDLLDLSRVDAGQLDVRREPVELASIARSLRQDLGHLAATSGHELEVQAPRDVWVRGDAARVSQIAGALVTNALIHTSAGTHVTIAVRQSGLRGELVVENDGPGIPESQQEAIFERFYRVEGGRASGSGLGLAIARELARLMGGSVRLESATERTAFVLDLPSEPEPASFSRENDDERQSTSALP
jgi:signal transduction histidine kinase